MLDLKTVHFYEEVVLTNPKLVDLELKPLESVVGKMSKPCIFSTKYGTVMKFPTSLKRGDGVSLKSAVDKNEYLVNMIKEVHGNKYDYQLVKYSGHRGKVTIVCPTHGEFNVNPFNIISRKPAVGCSKCGNNSLSVEEFKEKASKKYKDKFDYSLVEYKRMVDKVTIVCLRHGKFKQSPHRHLYLEHGCRTCFMEARSPHYNIKNAELNREEWLQIKAKLYLVNIYNSKESFYKIGITTQTIRRRFGNNFKNKTGYKVRTINIISSNLYDACLEEANIIKSMRKYKYKPQVIFGGSTECFHKNPLIEYKDGKFI